MKYLTILVFLSAQFSFGFKAFAQDNEAQPEPVKSCFSVSRARHDQQCYFIDNQAECLNLKDTYSCGWGVKVEKEHEDNDFASCRTSRCSDQEDAEEE